MRIAQIAPLAERVPPKKYGGTERVIYNLTEELVKLGHEVTLFASGDSKTSARLVALYPKSIRELGLKDIYGLNIPSMINTGTAYAMQEEFDVIHDHNPHLGLPTANIAQVPVVMTWHGPFNDEIIQYFTALNRTYLVSISESQRRGAPSLPFAGTVYNGLAMDNYPFSGRHKDYLLYVGRIDLEKGTHTAIDLAAASGRRLVIAAKYDDRVPRIRWYFQHYIEPRLRKHKKLVRWVGEVGEAKRNELMKNASCMLHPITWLEPFGLTLIEAMACGCPVVAFNLGSMPEIIENGKTGFVVETFEQALDAIKMADKIDRRYCRRYALNNFNAKKMALGYEAVYRRIIKKHRRQFSSFLPKAKKSSLLTDAA